MIVCQLNSVHSVRLYSSRRIWFYKAYNAYILLESGYNEYNMYKIVDKARNVDVFILTHMKTKTHDNHKVSALRSQGALNPHPDRVSDESFINNDFFDARDRVQVRYEMIRRHRIDEHPVSEVASSFGVSRQTFYVTDAIFSREGLAGLLPRRRGPKAAHKCTDEILDFVEQWRSSGDAATENIAEAVRRRFGVIINPRSIDRALQRRKKNVSRKQ
jgi:transposase